ncbi:MAG TPA: Holliday junction resolvase RuvX [Anaerovoracaceae bacterium]|nr:Holliday junction resolvase RuvX [Anaerovoracaceae bacterium]
MRALSLDVGDKTIGLAVSDPLGITAQGITTIERVGIKKDTGKVIDYIKEYDCDTVVIGLPKNLNGTDSVQTEKVYEFKDRLENKLRSMGLPKVKLVWQDERFTTVIAERVLIDADVRRKDRKKVIDKQAAVVILQSYLDGKGNE